MALSSQGSQYVEQSDVESQQFTSQFAPMLPRDHVAETNNNIALFASGLRSRHTALSELGERDPDAEIERILSEPQLDKVPGKVLDSDMPGGNQADKRLR